jgi:hypothetical protein
MSVLNDAKFFLTDIDTARFPSAAGSKSRLPLISSHSPLSCCHSISYYVFVVLGLVCLMINDLSTFNSKSAEVVI